MLPAPCFNVVAATDSPLLVAARKKQKETVESLIASGADIKSVNKKGWTVLHYAAKNGWLSIVQSLVDKGAEIDVKLPPPDLRTPILVAAAGNHTNVVTFLIKAGADLTCRDGLNRTVFYYACKKGMLDVVQLLSERGFNLKDSSLSNKWPLFVAAENHQREIVRFFIESGASVNIADANGWTLLHYAAKNGWLSIAQSLVYKGAELDVELPPPDRRTPVLVAAAGNFTFVMASERRCDWEEAPLCFKWPVCVMAEDDQREIVRYLIESGANVDIADEGGRTLLHLAARNLWPEVVKQIAERVRDCDKKEYIDFETPLHFACRFSTIWSIFRRRDEEEDERSKLLEKAISDFVEIVEILSEKGIYINSGNGQNETPAHLTFGSLYMMVDNKLLLRALNCLFKAGADCNLRDFCGRSLFKFFISSDNIDLVRLGIENGGYFKEGFDISMNKHPNIIEHILKDVSYCTRAIVNKYNNKDLPAFYETFDIGDTFPSIKVMEIGRDSGIVREIENAVICDIEARGYCNILQISPLSLSLLIVKSILKQY